MTQTYTLNVADLTRNLPIIPVSNNLAIASFVLLGDAEMAHCAATALKEKMPANIDYLVTAEAKGIPLVQELAFQMGHPSFIVARKSIKTYMENPLIEKVQSITTSVEQQLCLDGKDAQLLAGKNVALIDDVISTGESLAVLKKLAEKASANVVAQGAILAEGDACKREDIVFLAELPLFPL